MDKSNNIIGSRILKLRTRAGEKQEELAQAIHCNRGSLSNYEKGARTPDAYTIALIAKHYNATSDYLLGLTDTPSTNRDIAFISDYTGLDESTIQEFHSQKSFIPTHTNNNYESTMYQNLLLHRVWQIINERFMGLLGSLLDDRHSFILTPENRLVIEGIGTGYEETKKKYGHTSKSNQKGSDTNGNNSEEE